MYDFIFGIQHLAYGVIAFIFAILLYDFDYIGGWADIKVITIIGMMITNIQFLAIMMLLVTAYGTIYKGIWIVKGKLKEDDEVPFLIPLTAVYLFLLFTGGII